MQLWCFSGSSAFHLHMLLGSDKIPGMINVWCIHASNTFNSPLSAVIRLVFRILRQMILIKLESDRFDINNPVYPSMLSVEDILSNLIYLKRTKKLLQDETFYHEFAVCCQQLQFSSRVWRPKCSTSETRPIGFRWSYSQSGRWL